MIAMAGITMVWAIVAVAELYILGRGVYTSQEILDEMDADMEDSGMAQGEIESNLNHWKNKYIITKK